MLDVRRLRLLRDLARLGTIAAVAQARSYTPSAVSQQLTALEREAGVRLLRRAGRGIALTPAGADLAARSEAVLALLEEAEAALAGFRAELAGELRIGAFTTAVRTLLPAALVALAARHPRLELQVSELDPVQVPDALRTGALDIALVHEYDYVPAKPDPALDTEPLLAEKIFLATAGGAADTGAANTGAADTGAADTGAADTGAANTGAQADPVRRCAAAPWIVASPGTLCYLMAVRLFQAAGFTPRIRHHADDFATVLALVAAGQGVALVPELALADPPAGVELTALTVRRRTLIAYRAGAGAHPAIAACAGALRAAAEGLPAWSAASVWP
jgi:DNA-binding transcriptional LysR family regulator